MRAQDLMLSIGWMERALDFASVRLPGAQATVWCFKLTGVCSTYSCHLKAATARLGLLLAAPVLRPVAPAVGSPAPPGRPPAPPDSLLPAPLLLALAVPPESFDPLPQHLASPLARRCPRSRPRGLVKEPVEQSPPAALNARSRSKYPLSRRLCQAATLMFSLPRLRSTLK